MLLQKPERERGVKKERILRVLLNHADGDLTKYRIAKVVDASEPWVLEYTKRLEEGGLIADTTVLDPWALYEEWQDIRSHRTSFLSRSNSRWNFWKRPTWTMR